MGIVIGVLAKYLYVSGGSGGGGGGGRAQLWGELGEFGRPQAPVLLDPNQKIAEEMMTGDHASPPPDTGSQEAALVRCFGAASPAYRWPGIKLVWPTDWRKDTMFAKLES
jgi:hypothetical protein